MKEKECPNCGGKLFRQVHKKVVISYFNEVNGVRKYSPRGEFVDEESTIIECFDCDEEIERVGDES